MYYSIVRNRVESSESRKSILNKYILLACIVTPPLNYLIFLCFSLLVNLFSFDFDFCFPISVKMFSTQL